VDIVVIGENGKLTQQKVDMSPTKDSVSTALGGPGTVIGQYKNGVVALKLREPVKGKHKLNKMKLPSPMQDEEVHGPILLIKMDNASEPLDFTLSDFELEFGKVESQPSNDSDSEFDGSDIESEESQSGSEESHSGSDDDNCVPPEFASMIQSMLKTSGPIVDIVVVAENGTFSKAYLRKS